MQKICFVNSNVHWGGGEKWHATFARYAQSQGHSTHVVGNVPSALLDALSTETNIHTKAMRLTNLSFLNPISFLRLYAYFNQHRFDTVILGLPRDLKVAGPAARMAGVRKVIYRRGMSIPVKNTRLNRFLYGSVLTHLIVNSQDTKRSTLAKNSHLIPDKHVHVLYNGIPTENSIIPPNAPPLFPQKPGQVIIGNAARLVEQKGHTHLIDAAVLLKKSGLDCKIVIAGQGPLREQLEFQARVEGVEDCIEFLGFVDNMDQFYHVIDIFVLPSLWEGFSNAPLEAMRAAKPVLAFDVSSLSEAVQNNATGFLVAKGDAPGLAVKLELLIRDAALRVEMGKKGRMRVLDKFALPEIQAAFNNIITG